MPEHLETAFLLLTAALVCVLFAVMCTVANGGVIMKVRYPAKVKRRRNLERQRRRLFDPCWKTECVQAKSESLAFAADEAIKDADDADQDDYDEELARISHLGAEITPCQPPQSWYDEDWSDFQDLHESIKEADCSGND